MASSVEDQDQVQPLDLSCPKVSQRCYANDSTSDDNEAEQLSPRFDHGLHRPRSSSGGSDESLSHAEFEHRARTVLSAASLLRAGFPGFPQAAAVSALIGGPARKRFLTKYLHKENGEFQAFPMPWS